MAPPDPPTDPVTSLLDGVDDSLSHAASMLQSSLSGSYGIRDAFLDAMECSIRASNLGVDTLQALGILPPRTAAQPNPTVVTVDVPVDPALATALKANPLKPGELRAIGYGSLYRIPADKVQVGAPKQAHGLTTVTVTVSFADVGPYERDHTLVYEGLLTAWVPKSAPLATYTVRIPKPAH
jgi:hypothetical protein